MNKSPQDRLEEIALIEAAAKDSDSCEFETLLTAFELDDDISPNDGYRQSLEMALQKGTWRQASRPLSVLRKAALSVAFGRRVKRAGVEIGGSEEEMDLAWLRNVECSPVRDKIDHVWRAGRPSLNPYREEGECTRPLIERIRANDKAPAINWKTLTKAFEHAGLDELEKAFVLGYLGQKRARAKFLAEHGKNPAARRAAYAAVKRVQRKLPKIRQRLVGD